MSRSRGDLLRQGISIETLEELAQQPYDGRLKAKPKPRRASHKTKSAPKTIADYRSPLEAPSNENRWAAQFPGNAALAGMNGTKGHLGNNTAEVRAMSYYPEASKRRYTNDVFMLTQEADGLWQVAWDPQRFTRNHDSVYDFPIPMKNDVLECKDKATGNPATFRIDEVYGREKEGRSSQAFAALGSMRVEMTRIK